MAKLSAEKIEQINKVYLETGTYAATARAVGCSPATVKKYIVKDFTPSEPKNKIAFSEQVIPIEQISSFKREDIAKLGRLSNLEVEEIHELWEEM